MQNMTKKYGMGASTPGMRETMNARDARILKMMNDTAMQNKQMMQAGGTSMMNLNADADIATDTCIGYDCGTKKKKYKSKKSKQTNRRAKKGKGRRY
mgnify:CR=1 FL=1